MQWTPCFQSSWWSTWANWWKSMWGEFFESNLWHGSKPYHQWHRKIPWKSRQTHWFSAISGGELIPSLGWWQLKYFLFSPLTVRDMIQFDEHIFSRWVETTIWILFVGSRYFCRSKSQVISTAVSTRLCPAPGHVLSATGAVPRRDIHWWSRDNRCLQMSIYLHIYMCRLFIYMIIYIYTHIIYAQHQ